MEYDALLALPNSTHASTIARAVAALICVFVKVLLAASPESVTLSKETGVAP